MDFQNVFIKIFCILMGFFSGINISELDLNLLEWIDLHEKSLNLLKNFGFVAVTVLGIWLTNRRWQIQQILDSWQSTFSTYLDEISRTYRLFTRVVRVTSRVTLIVNSAKENDVNDQVTRSRVEGLISLLPEINNTPEESNVVRFQGFIYSINDPVIESILTPFINAEGNSLDSLAILRSYAKVKPIEFSEKEMKMLKEESKQTLSHCLFVLDFLSSIDVAYRSWVMAGGVRFGSLDFENFKRTNHWEAIVCNYNKNLDSLNEMTLVEK